MTETRMKFSLDNVGHEIGSVMVNKQSVVATISVAEAYMIMQACQLTVTHPGLSVHMTRRMEVVGRRMQEALRPHISEFFAEFCEAGWHRENDD